MSRSNYTEFYEPLNLYRASVERAIKGRRGQAFLRELLLVLDAMTEKALIANELVSESGACCAIGAVCRARSIDVSRVDCYNPEAVANTVGISRVMAAEIEYLNDEGGCQNESPESRWRRMRAWAESNLTKGSESACVGSSCKTRKSRTPSGDSKESARPATL